jgi:uncharacterized membrane protein YfcA
VTAGWSLEFLAVVSAIFVLAGFVKGVVGMGLPTVSLGLLALAVGPKEAIALMLIPSLMTNIWQAVVGGNFVSLIRRLWSLLLAVCVGVWFGAGVLARSDAAVISGGLGLMLCLYAGVSLLTPKIPPPGQREGWLSPVIGGANGLLTGLTGTFVVPAVPYLQVLGLDRNALVQAMGILFSVSTLALAASFSGHSLLPKDLGLLSTVALAPAILGMVGGQWIRSRIPEPIFRRIIYWSLLVLGVYLIIKSFF